MKRSDGLVRLYSRLERMVESERNTTGWKTREDICVFLFDSVSIDKLEKTNRAVEQARKLLKQEHNKLFYHTENEGYVILSTADQHREIIKRHAAVSDGFRIMAGEIYTIGSKSLPSLKDLLTAPQLKQLQDGTKIFTDIKVKARQKSTS